MYPMIRYFWHIARYRKDQSLGMFDTHESTYRCLPMDIDPWMEMNNGRTLTLFDLGRVGLSLRTGLRDVVARKGWGLTVAGSVVRYRRRIRMFDKVTMKSRFIGFDHRFFYIEQSMWKENGDCANHVIIRMATVGKSGMIAPAELAAAFGHQGPSPDLPDWVLKWIEAEDARPWPPVYD